MTDNGKDPKAPTVVSITDGTRYMVVALGLLFVLLAVLAISDAIVQAETGHQDATVVLILRFITGLIGANGAAIIGKMFLRRGI